MTDYYTCQDCGDMRMSCGCTERRAAEREAYWRDEHEKNVLADSRFRAFLDTNNMTLEDRESLERILSLSQRQIAAVKGYANLT